MWHRDREGIHMTNEYKCAKTKIQSAGSCDIHYIMNIMYTVQWISDILDEIISINSCYLLIQICYSHGQIIRPLKTGTLNGRRPPRLKETLNNDKYM